MTYDPSVPESAEKDEARKKDTIMGMFEALTGRKMTDSEYLLYMEKFLDVKNKNDKTIYQSSKKVYNIADFARDYGMAQ